MTSAKVSEVRICCASMREAVRESHGRETVSNPWWPEAHVARLAPAAHTKAVKSSTVAATKPRLRRRRVSRQSHHCASPKKMRAATSPDSGTHCGRVRRCCWWETFSEVRAKSSEAAGRIWVRMSADALDM